MLLKVPDQSGFSLNVFFFNASRGQPIWLFHSQSQLLEIKETETDICDYSLSIVTILQIVLGAGHFVRSC